MPIYKPSELKNFLNALQIFPKKGLSQNFLIDGNIIRKIITSSEASSQDLILEVGPGPGSLTQALLEMGARVIAVEMDSILSKALERLQTPSGQLSIFCQDILTFSAPDVLPKQLKDNKKAKIIANLPYHLTTPILAKFCPQREYFSSLTVMVQEEVARRMTAKVGSKDYSSLTIFLSFYAELNYAFSVSHHCFYPAPKVNSAVVHIKLREPPLNKEKAIEFFKITRTAFEHRRKMLRSSLRLIYEPSLIEHALGKIGESPLARPEELSLDQFLKLYELLSFPKSS